MTQARAAKRRTPRGPSHDATPALVSLRDAESHRDVFGDVDGDGWQAHQRHLTRQRLLNLDDSVISAKSVEYLEDLQFSWSRRTESRSAGHAKHARRATEEMHAARAACEAELAKARRARGGCACGPTVKVQVQCTCRLPKRREAAERRAEYHQRRAKKAEVFALWHRGRGRGMDIPLIDALTVCGKRMVTMRCGCYVTERPVGCGRDLLCRRCARERASKYGRRARVTLESQLAEARAAWAARGGRRHKRAPGEPWYANMEPMVYLVTFTRRHTGDAKRDAELLDESWRKFRQHRAKGHWVRRAAVMLEISAEPAGRGLGRGDAHPHLHAVVVAQWVDVNELRREWMQHAPDSPFVNVQRLRRDGVSRGAQYITKYATKGVDIDGLDPIVAGEVMSLFVARRRVRAARGWWRYEPPCCPRCRARFRLVAPPPSLARAAADALRAGDPRLLGAWFGSLAGAKAGYIGCWTVQQREGPWMR